VFVDTVECIHDSMPGHVLFSTLYVILLFEGNCVGTFGEIEIDINKKRWMMVLSIRERHAIFFADMDFVPAFLLPVRTN
jgi:hypothetical protein